MSSAWTSPAGRPRQRDVLQAPRRPVVLAYGMGVDSTAMMIELVARGEAPDLVLTADTGSEKPATYAYLDIIKPWIERHNLDFRMCRYQPQRFKHWPPYATIVENVLTNATLPSISLGRHSCSLKWKVAPQDKFIASWQPAVDAWQRGQKVVRLIGYDASPADTRRHAHALTIASEQFECRYPLREWGWSRTDCIARIEAEGLPVPPKSACFLCCGSKPDEIRELPAWCLRLIVLVEARAAPRLRTVEGLWRSSTRTRPGRMTDFIRSERLLEPEEIDRIECEAPSALMLFQEAAAKIPLPERPHLADWIDQFQLQLENIA